MKLFRNIAGVILGLCIIIIVIGCTYFNIQVSPVDKNNDTQIEVVIETGTTVTNVGKILEEKELIRSATFFKLYAKIYKVNDVKATTYMFSKDMSMSEIVESLQQGNSYNPDEVTITFQEGINIRRIAKIISTYTNNTYDSVLQKLEDEEYINSLINEYWFITDIIKNDSIYYSLEGYLYPDTYKFSNKDVTIEEIFKKMLDRMQIELDKYKEQIETSNMSVHEYLTVASMLELEGTNLSNRKDIASVFYNRLTKNMSLGSDVTTYYAAKVEMNERDLYKSELNANNPYNTRGPNMEGKLPVGPICIMSSTSIEAAINPNDTDYLYFVADKYKNIFFTKTYKEHQNLISEIKARGDWIEW